MAIGSLYGQNGKILESVVRAKFPFGERDFICVVQSYALLFQKTDMFKVSMTEDDQHKPVYFGKIANLRKKSKRRDYSEKDKIYRRLADEINEPDPLRSKVLTLHLYIEYWLDNIIEKEKNKGKDFSNVGTFHQKNESLHNLKIIDDHLYSNIEKINKIRNIYAHTLELEKVQDKVHEYLSQIKFSPDFDTSSQDILESIVIQSMFELEEIYLSISGDADEYTDEDIRDKLIKEGEIFWQYCKIINKHAEPGNEEVYELKCPYCFEGKIIKIDDRTPGFKSSFFIPCDKCGLTGEGSNIIFRTIKDRNP